MYLEARGLGILKHYCLYNILVLLLQEGSNVMMGKYQLPAFASTPMRSPSILVVDEATNALDARKTEGLTDHNIPLRKTTTVVAVARNLSTIQGSESVYVLLDGYMVAYFTHDDLS